jgi:myo-inositol 2-dehydrogenase / D-chiro-inositol 1-dehydrogenase
MSEKATRRDFLKTSAVVGGAAVGGLSLSRGAHAAEDNILKIGIIGCGGRGSGAVSNALNADPNTKLWAMADAFEDRLAGSLNNLKNGANGDRIDVTPERCFVGLKGYQDLIDSGVDVVLLATPPQFRPEHLRAAVAAGKHVFCEKPVAVDAPGIRSVLESTRIAKEKSLTLVSGLCWRYHDGVKETMNRVLDGAIGDIHTIQENYLTGKLWTRARQEGDTELKYQCRNWYNFGWLSGDFNVEQHVHSLDKAVWAFGDQPPVSVYGLGARSVRIEQPEYGDIYDQMAVVYEYPDDRKVFAYCRQQNDCFNETTDHFYGSKGYANILRYTVKNDEGTWRSRAGGNMYEAEHVAMFDSIRNAKAVNNGEYMSTSTMMGIVGRMVCYTGAKVTWEDAMASEWNLTLDPENYNWDADPVVLPDEQGRYEVALPGITKFI